MMQRSESDGSRSTRASSRSSNSSYSSRRKAQIQQAASVCQAEQQLAVNTSANSSITSTTSHPTLVVDRRAMRLASRARRIVKVSVMGPSGARRPSDTRRTAARPSHPQTEKKAPFIQEHGLTPKPASPH